MSLLRSLLILPFCTACYFFRSASVPLPAVNHPTPADRSSALMVLLPGLLDGPEDYEEYGFIQHIHQAKPQFDVIAADAHLAYYRNFSIVQRLHEDVIEAKLSPHHQKLWLVGISMGGFGALAYTMAHPEHVDGLILLAPYLGDSGVLEEIKAAGGLQNWQPTIEWQKLEPSEVRKTYELWSWLKTLNLSSEAKPKILLGFGLSDKSVASHRLLAGVLPPNQVHTMPGEHKWVVWTPLFKQLLSRVL